MAAAAQTTYGPDAFFVRVKPGVVFAPIAPAGIRLLWAVQECCRILKTDLLLTAGTDGHSTGHHVTGEAIDIGVVGLSPEMILAVRTGLMALLGNRFYVQFEVRSKDGLPEKLKPVAVENPAATGPHIHAQLAIGQVYPPAPTSRLTAPA